MKLSINYMSGDICSVNVGTDIFPKNCPLALFTRKFSLFLKEKGELKSSMQDIVFLNNLANYFSIDLPPIKEDAEMTRLATERENQITLGAGSNNVKFESVSNVKIESVKRFVKGKEVDRVYFNCINVVDDSKFVYYLDLKSKKRFFKEKDMPKDFFRLDDLKSLEIPYISENNKELVSLFAS